MKKVISLLLVSLILMSMCIFASAEGEKALTFGSDGKFTVLQISDPQDDHYPAPDMLKLIELSIEQTNPDLIVFTGDIVEDERKADEGVDDEDDREGVTVEGDYAQTLANVKTACKAVFSAVEKADIPFAIAMGNNDYQSGVTAEDWLKIFESYENCIVRDESPDSNGRIDYNLEIKSDNGKTLFNIWMMDTGETEITAEQIDWYKKESDALKAANGGEAVPSVWFQHIQTDDIGNLFEECSFLSKGAKKSGNKYYRLNPDIASGYFQSISAPGKTSEVFKAWKQQGDVLGAYFGHMHTEGYTGTYDRIELGFTYGCEFSKDGPYGIRVFTLYEDDIKNYGNELYTYEGSVKKGNARLELQTGYSNDNIKTTTTVFNYIFKTLEVIYKVIKIIFVCTY